MQTEDSMHTRDRGRLIAGWGRNPATLGVVYQPQCEADLVDFRAGARGRITRGLGRSYGDAAQNAGGTVVDLTGLNEIVDLDEVSGTITAAAGASLADILEAVVPRGWCLPVLPGTGHVTVGGAIAADVHGKNHVTEGSFGRHVVSFDLVTPDGVATTVTPDKHPDLFRATLGGMGLTGTVARATLALTPIETSSMLVENERCTTLEGVLARFREAAPWPYAVAWLDMSRRPGRIRGVFSRARHARHDELPRGLLEIPLRMRARSAPGVPVWFPPGIVNRASVRLFNAAKYWMAPAGPRRRIEHMQRFFFPLDTISNWNHLYGRRGFLQYQFAVPFGHEGTLGRIATLLGTIDGPRSLAVLKQLGDQEGLLSFPIPGWTLSVDLALGSADLATTLDRCDELVIGAGGRVYLAKDSRLSARAVRRMYPHINEWLDIKEQVDPLSMLRSDLGRRLELVG